jgi:hypothetical protein
MRDYNHTRPLRTIPRSQKNDEYHYKYAMWCLNAINCDQTKYFQAKALVNWNFIFGNQWILDDDLEIFMMDESGETRNRLKVVENTIRPMVNQLVGKVIQTDLTAKAIASSDRSVSRMERELSRLLFFQKMYAKSTDPSMRELIKSKVPVSDDVNETFDRFSRFWRDEYAEAMNILLKDVSELNNFEQLKARSAYNLAATGMSVLKGYELNGCMKWKNVDPLFFIFDPSAKEGDLSDGSFWGEYAYEDPAYILERFQGISPTWRAALEDSSQNIRTSGSFHQDLSVFGVPMGRVPVYEIYWRDTEEQLYGYVVDEFGYELFTRLDDEGGKYSISDAFLPEDEEIRSAMKGKAVKRIFQDVLRHCVFCPADYVGNPDAKGEPLILDYGVVKNSETYLSDISNVQPPYKVATWSYHNGYIQAPVDDAIGPQRFLNRLLSMAESNVNNSRGANVFYDKDMIDEQGGEQELLSAMNTGKPVGVHAKGNLNNSVIPYDTTVKSGTMSLFEIAQAVRNSIDNSTGRNVAMRGQQGGKRESGVVVDAMLESGFTMQEPYFFAISQQFLAVSKSVATVGKKIYIKNKRKLALKVGDGMSKVITLHPDMELEDFKIYVKRALPEDQSKALANQDLKELAQLGLVDEEAMSKWYGHAGVENISTAIQETFNRKIEKSKTVAKEQEQMAQQQAEQMAAEAERQEELNAAASDVERTREVENLAIKGQQGIDKLALREQFRQQAQNQSK